MADVFKRRLRPVEDDDEGENQTAESIEPPYPCVKAHYAGAWVSGGSRFKVRERRGGTNLWEMLLNRR